MPASINSTAIQLEHLLRKINQRLLAELPSTGTVKPHEIHTSPKILEMGNWARQIDLHLKHLKQAEHSLQFRSSRVHGLPREHRFQEKQSIASRQGNIDKTLALALEAKKRLRALFLQAIRPDAIERTNAFFDLVDDGLKEIQEIQVEIGKAVQAGQLNQQEAVQMKTVISNQVPILKEAPANAVPMVDALLMVSILLRLLALSLQSRKQSGPP